MQGKPKYGIAERQSASMWPNVEKRLIRENRDYSPAVHTVLIRQIPLAEW